MATGPLAELKSWVSLQVIGGINTRRPEDTQQQEQKLSGRTDRLAMTRKLIRQTKLSGISPTRLLLELIDLNRAGFLLAINYRQNEKCEAFIRQMPLKAILKTLLNPNRRHDIYCPLLTAMPTPEKWHAPTAEAHASSILRHLQSASLRKEATGLLFDPEYVLKQISHWRLSLDPGKSILANFASLPKPYRQIISPHPLFDNQYYLRQRSKLNASSKNNRSPALKSPPSRVHPIADYLQNASSGQLLHWIEPSSNFIPSLWAIYKQGQTGLQESPYRCNPLSHYLKTMNDSSTSCPLLNHRIGGHVEGLDSTGMLRGWCCSVRAGEVPHLEVWMDGILLGHGLADEHRADIARRGLERRHCGFNIQLNLAAVPVNKLLSIEFMGVQVVTSDHQVSLGRGHWLLKPEERQIVVDHLVRRALAAGEVDLLASWLKQENDQSLLPPARYRMVQWASLCALAGCWDSEAVRAAQRAIRKNPSLLQGLEAESCARAELILLALEHFCRCCDQDHLLSFSAPSHSIAQTQQERTEFFSHQLSERCHFSPTALEQQCWAEQLRPLFNLALATLLNQGHPPDLSDLAPLLQAFSRLSAQVFGDLQLADTLTSLIEPPAASPSADRLRLQLRSGAFLPVAIALHHQLRSGNAPALEPFDHALALLELSKQSLITIEAALKRLLPLIPLWQARNPRLSFSRRLLDQLGWHVNTLAFGLLDQFIDLGLPPSLGLSVRERANHLLEQISQALWSDPGSGCTPLPASNQPPLRWLLIGEQGLSQCWLYRVEQKCLQLEQLGAEVRCIDRSHLDDWSCTQDIAWADAIVFCRTPATYPVIRALTFARHSGKQVLADVDDLVFTADFPAPLSTYGGSISPATHRRLRLDPPLQRWTLEHADAVITSTEALADACRNTSDALATKPIHVLPNLPLPQLQGLSRRLEALQLPHNRPPHLVVSSGTHAHKQIWSEQLAPVLAQLLERHPGLRLSLLGHLTLPTCLEPFSARIRCLPYSDYAQYLQQLSEGTICLVPLESHPTTDAKSAIKWMEASLLGLACVCSPVRAYTDAGVPEQHLLSADGPEQWLQQIERLLADPALHARLVDQAQQQVHTLFHDGLAEHFWRPFLAGEMPGKRRRLLVINVFFSPQSIGGATRVAQDQVLELLDRHRDAYDITVLCADHDPWQDTNRDQLPLDTWHWHGARIVRLAVPPKPWSHVQDGRVEAFCRQWFQQQAFDLIHCHCCQILTASPLLVAQDLGIPYLVSLHDAWWLSPKLFLVSHAGRLINPADPLDHIDGTPSPQDKADALERRSILSAVLQGARARLAVSDAFRRLYQDAGIEQVDVLENRWTPMTPAQPRTPRRADQPLRLCHVGGMAIHKGYPLLRQAAHLLPPNLPITFTVLDHHLAESDPEYSSLWNGYPVRFRPPVPMQAMAEFYASQDVLLAPSIWPESFGLVTREALSAGLWVIASDIGALANPIDHNRNGTVIPANDAQALAAAIQALVNPDEEGQQLQAAMAAWSEAGGISGSQNEGSSLYELVFGQLV